MTPNFPPVSGPFIASRRPLSRRLFLRGAGVALALPWLESMLPVFARAAEPAGPGVRPRRFLGINNNLGVLPDQFFPKKGGRDYEASPYLATLQEFRHDFTVFSGVSYPNVDGGHPADICFLTAAPHPSSSSFRNTISLDQHIAERIGMLTRFPSLTLGVNTAGRGLSWTGAGVAIPPEDKAAEVFKQLFLQGSAEQIEQQVRQLDTGRSILDTVGAMAKDLEKKVTAGDRERLDQYYTSVRDLEGRLQASRGWEHKAKPVVNVPPPIDPASPAAYMDKIRIMYNLARLAFETDSTRAITLMLSSISTPVVDLPDAEITDSYHNLSHHGKADDKRAQLKILDLWHLKLLAGLLGELKAVREGEETLLDRTMILFGSNMGDANAHLTTNMPILFAGGGFRHGQHLAFDPVRNYPLSNLYVSILQRLGINEEKFASGTAPMRGLDLT